MAVKMIKLSQENMLSALLLFFLIYLHLIAPMGIFMIFTAKWQTTVLGEF
jgi:hypothetical protein